MMPRMRIRCCQAIVCCPGRNFVTVKITTDTGVVVTMKVGQTLEVTLEGNPSTGYEWTVAAPAGTALEQVGEAEFKSQSTLTGAPGTYLFRFKAKAKGETELKFEYKRSWETTPQDEKLSFKVSVK